MEIEFKIPENFKDNFSDVDVISFEERNNLITGSTISCTIGANPYITPVQLWSAMISGTEPEVSEYAQKKMKAGKKIEKVIVEFFLEEQKPDDYFYFEDKYVSFRSKIYPFLGGTPDLIYKKDGKVYIGEIKNMGAATAKAFIEGAPPLHYYCQALLYSFLFNTDGFSFMVLIDGYDYQFFGPFPKDQKSILNLIREANIFYNENYLKKIPPEPVTYKDVLTIYPKSNSQRIEANEEIKELVKMLQDVKLQLKYLEEREEMIKARIGEFMKDNEILTINGNPVISFKSFQSERLSINKLKQMEPEIYEKFLETKENRVFKLIKGGKDE
jgi:predicted phage-related endonuclease